MSRPANRNQPHTYEHSLLPGVRLTETQWKILAVLEDGFPHGRWEIVECMPDKELVNYTNSNLAVMLHRLRERIEPVGHTILCQYIYHRRKYRWVRLLHHTNDGRK